MRVLTVQQPWAWAIFHGKDVENRTQAFKYRGPLAIHAGARWSERGAWSPLVLDAARGARPIFNVQQVSPPIDLGQCVDKVDFRLGAILGVVQLDDAHVAEPDCCASPWGEQSYVEHGGAVRKQIVHLELGNPVEFEHPVLNVKGRLGIWTPDADLADAIGAAA